MEFPKNISAGRLGALTVVVVALMAAAVWTAAEPRDRAAAIGAALAAAEADAALALDIHEWPVPWPNTRPRDPAVAPDGRIWWVDAAAGFLGVYDPKSRAMRQWQSPGGERSALYATAVDAKDRVWYVETGMRPNRFIGFDTRAEQFIATTEVPSGGGSVRHMVFHRPTNTIWFGTDTHTIGRAIVP